MTVLVDWRELFDRGEARVYELLLDVDADSWHILDILAAEGLRDRPVDGDAIASVIEPLRKALTFIHEVLTRHSDVIPPICLRPGRYPWIRQHRDVHQFDVGSHLACCCALACRGLGPLAAERAGCTVLATRMTERLAATPGNVMPTAAVFHDIFKCFRPRRPLPSKIGPKPGCAGRFVL